ncbi:hypothetical protein NKJ70_05905 [Mesorhizobium sp. M0092]|uniref:hypothetical protein n=1 Tax=Mesorhizobium sp. M0092 TaxID=2956876 RepID=UPI00333ADA0E
MQEIIRELARQARIALPQESKDLVSLHSIRIIEAIPFRQLRATASALHCKIENPSATEEEMLRVERSRSASAYAISGVSVDSDERTLAAATKTKIGDLGDGPDLARVKAAVVRALTRAEAPTKSCAFIADFGIKFEESSWFLISGTCSTGMLVRDNDDWRRVKQYQLRNDELGAVLGNSAK